MQQFCTNCGTKLPDNSFACPNCGALTDHAFHTSPANAYNQPSDLPLMPTEKVRKGSFKWLFALIPAVLIVAILLAFLWQPILMAISPKTALAMAMNKTADGLKERHAGSPAAVLEKGANCMVDGNVLLEAEGKYQQETLRASLDMAYCHEKNQTYLQASVAIPQLETGAQMYVDGEFAAVSADFFHDGAFYGITYDTFRADAMKSVLSQWLTEEDIAQADEMLQSLVDLYCSDVDEDDLIEPYIALIREFVLNLEMEKGSDTVSVDGKDQSCATVTFVMTEDDVVALCRQLLNMLEDDEQMKDYLCHDGFASISGDDLSERWHAIIDTLDEGIDLMEEELELDAEIVFYVQKGRVVIIMLDAEAEVEEEPYEVTCEINFGAKSTSDLRCKLRAEYDGEGVNFDICSVVTDDTEKYQEKVTCVATSDYDDEIELELITKWNKESGKLTLKLSGSEDDVEQLDLSLTCKLQELDNGFCISLDEEDIQDVLEMMDMELPEDLELTISITCTEGSEITVPTYVNLDKWDEDLVADLEDAFVQLVNAQ